MDDVHYALGFQGIQATVRHQATTMLVEAGVDASEEEWDRSKWPSAVVHEAEPALCPPHSHVFCASPASSVW